MLIREKVLDVIRGVRNRHDFSVSSSGFRLLEFRTRLSSRTFTTYLSFGYVRSRPAGAQANSRLGHSVSRIRHISGAVTAVRVLDVFSGVFSTPLQE